MITYFITIRGPVAGKPPLERTIRARDKEHANSLALEMAADLGDGYRVSRVDLG